MSKHHVTVIDGQLTSFVCLEDDAKCHTYPACDCPEWCIEDHAEEYGPGHELVHHADCWMKGWFDAPESTCYAGDDHEDWDYCADGFPEDFNRFGYIETEWDECVVWWFIEEES